MKKMKKRREKNHDTMEIIIVLALVILFFDRLLGILGNKKLGFEVMYAIEITAIIVGIFVIIKFV